jgi:prepilin-type processing-associated H-X9-DG protein
MTVVAIVGVLVALLFPAVMSARESARRAECQNNIRQLGIALQHFHALHRRFPPGTENEWSWQAQILSLSEESSVYAQFDLAREPFEAPNHRATDSIIPILLCPSDGRSDRIFEPSYIPGFRFALTNYFGLLDGDDRVDRGMFGEYSSVRISQVQDGTSQTLFVGERGVVEANGRTHGWWVWGPETVLSARGGLRPGRSSDQGSEDHWWSHHPGGAHFLFVDGSVQLLAYDIDPYIFRCMATKDGGEVVPSI